MAADDVYGMTETEWRIFKRMIAKFGVGTPQAGLDESRLDRRQPIVVCLLDALESGQSVDAIVMGPASNSKQMLTAYGSPAVGYFNLGFKVSATAKVEWTPNIYPNVDTADVIQGYLARLPSVGIGNVEVTLGIVQTSDEVTHNLWTWQIVWWGKFEGQPMQLLQVESHMTGASLLVRADCPLIPTERIETIHEVIGVPTPTPLRAGARGVACWIDGVGYCLHAAGARDFGDYGLFA